MEKTSSFRVRIVGRCSFPPYEASCTPSLLVRYPFGRVGRRSRRFLRCVSLRVQSGCKKDDGDGRRRRSKKNPNSIDLRTFSNFDGVVEDDEKYMRIALEEARLAFQRGEVPVGAVAMDNTGAVIARAHNLVETDGDPTAHAEILCLRKAAAASGRSWRLLNVTLYVTLEPCVMCAGALLQARVARVVYGAKNPLLGGDGSWLQVLPECGSHVDRQNQTEHPSHPFHSGIVIRRGILQDDCAALMKDFFKSRRLQAGIFGNGTSGADEIKVEKEERQDISDL